MEPILYTYGDWQLYDCTADEIMFAHFVLRHDFALTVLLKNHVCAISVMVFQGEDPCLRNIMRHGFSRGT